jgi:hypothetical protein
MTPKTRQALSTIGDPQRRRAISLVSMGVFGAMTSRLDRALPAAPPASRPLLATPEQVDAEKALLQLLKDPEIKRIQLNLKSSLGSAPRSLTADGAARLDNAIAQWTNSLIFAELAGYRASPAILWGTDDTPRTWLGHTVGGVGVLGVHLDDIAGSDGTAHLSRRQRHRELQSGSQRKAEAPIVRIHQVVVARCCQDSVATEPGVNSFRPGVIWAFRWNK